MSPNKYNNKITCCYLYPITKYGYPPPAEKTLEYLDEMSELGFSSVELEGIREKHLMKVYEMRFEIKEKLNQLDLELPYFCAVLPELSSMDEDLIKHNIELFGKGCELASLFNAKGILDNGPIPPYQFERGIPVLRHYEENEIRDARLPKNFSWEQFYENLVSTFRILCEIAEKYNLTYQLHPATGVITYTADDYLKFYNAVGKRNLKFNFDTANLFAHNEDLLLSLNKLKDHIDYIHLSDNRGEKIEHLPIGAGLIDWNAFFRTLKEIQFEGRIGIDVGGDESNVQDLDYAYKSTAQYLTHNWLKD